MLVRAGTAVSIPVMFASGVPDAGVAYLIYDPTGVVVGSGTIAVQPDEVSTLLQIDATHNVLADGELLSYRDIAWSYAVGGHIINDELRYEIEARMPFGASADGVRAKLGAEKKDLPDSDIALARALISFRQVTPVDTVDATDLFKYSAVRDAIEAQAALALIPTMAVRVASKESSGTNQYQRQKIEWDDVRTHLEGLVSAGHLAADPLYDETTGFESLLIVVTPAVDRFTGA